MMRHISLITPIFIFLVCSTAKLSAMQKNDNPVCRAIVRGDYTTARELLYFEAPITCEEIFNLYQNGDAGGLRIVSPGLPEDHKLFLDSLAHTEHTNLLEQPCYEDLIDAIKANNPTRVRKILEEENVAINKPDEYEKTFLDYAVEYNLPEIAEIFVLRGAAQIQTTPDALNELFKNNKVAQSPPPRPALAPNSIGFTLPSVQEAVIASAAQCTAALWSLFSTHLT